MNTEMTIHQDQTSLTEQMEFARAVVAQPERGAQSILPDSYKGNPANVMIAVGLGASMGLSPAESLYRISVIKGKPSAGAELIAANVRKAGHKLRVRGDETSCTATIIRADDPDFTFEVARDMDWAKKMGLSSNDNYRKQPGTMLQWRAITAVARLACPEALYGVAYTPDELAEQRPAEQSVERSGAARMRSTLQVHEPDQGLAEAPLVDSLASQQPEPEPDAITQAQQRKMGALMREAGLTERGPAIAYVNSLIGREVESRNQLSKAEAGTVIDALEAEAQQAPVDLSDAPEANEAEWPPVQEAPDA